MVHPLDAPKVLGRGAVVLPGQQAPTVLSNALRIRIDEQVLTPGHRVIDQLHEAWAMRQPVVVELAVDPSVLTEDEISNEPAYRLGVAFLFPKERLRYLVWANNADLRFPHADYPQGRWWHSVKAVERFGFRMAGAQDNGDVLDRDGLPLWIDGGPRDGIAGLGRLVHREDLEAGLVVPLGSGADPKVVAALTPDQRTVVEAGHGAIRVPAPAGSGKTRVLTARLGTLLGVRNHPPQGILTLVYNTRAAEELRERVGNQRTTINTVHAHAYSLLRGVFPQVRVLDEREIRQILGRLITPEQKANQDPFAAWIEAFDEIRAALLDPEQAANQYPDLPNLASTFLRYRQILRDSQAIDFAEMVPWATDLLLTNATLRRQAQGQAREVLVDEFQDLTPAYLLYIRLLASPQLAVLGVGDDDQVIYGHAGANPDFLINFNRFFPGSCSQLLSINHRCPKAVVEQTNNLLSHNKQRISKDIQPGIGASAEPIGFHTVPDDGEADQAVSLIQGWLAQGVSARDIAVLARINVSLLPVQAALTLAGIGVASPIRSGLMERSTVRAALTYLRLGLDGEMAGSDLADILHRPLRAIPGTVKGQLSGRRWSVQDLRTFPERFHSLGAFQRKAWDRFIDDLAGLRRAVTRQPSAEVIRRIVHDIDLGSVATSLEEHKTQVQGTSHTDDLTALTHVAKYCTDIHEFPTFLSKVLNPPPPDQAAITLSSIHRVKGLEWPYVILIGANEGLMPHRMALNPKAIEEERRVFHVAITRAKTQLHIISQRQQPSRFVAEMNGTPPTQAPRRRVDSSTPVTARPSRRTHSKPPIIPAVIGMEIKVAGGLTGTIVDMDDRQVFMKTQSRAILRIMMGATVTVEGKRVRIGKRHP